MMATLTPMMQQYLQLKEQNKDCILMFRLGDFYEMFFEDAILASKILEIALTGRDCGLEERAPMCGVPHHSVNSYINRLIESGHKVAICDQLEDASKAKGLVERGITRIITPGTVTEDTLLNEKENNYIISLSVLGNQFGLCYCDVSTGEFCIADAQSEIQLLNTITGLAPREAIAADSSCKQVLQLFEKIKGQDIHVTPWNDSYFDAKQAERALKKHFRVQSLKGYGVEGNAAGIGAAGALIEYLNATQLNALEHINKIKPVHTLEYMQLDHSTRRNLELTQTIMQGHKKGSLLWLLDKTKTAAGARKLKQYVTKPLVQPSQINNRLDAVSEVFENHILLAGYKGCIAAYLQQAFTKTIYRNRYASRSVYIA
jgi:DNA mismatch repair protein MutS